MFDYLFAGGGASATLLLMSMERRGMLKGKKIAVLDPDSKSVNDKTYCFWENPDHQLAVQCGHLVSHQWKKASVNQNPSESLFPMHYFHVSSSDLYTELQQIIQTHGLQRIPAYVSDLEAEETHVKVVTDKGLWLSKTVFDSRPPKYLPTQNTEAHLLQSFIGFVVETEDQIPDPDRIDLMDFEVEQLGWTQFVYVLPFGPNKMLVELTRFGEVPITKEEAQPILDEYILSRFNNYKILDTEKGCIPMSTAKLGVAPIPGVISIGGRAGAIKPSTGYAFKNMYTHAEALADSLLKGSQPASISTSSRFLFYDHLLLSILSKQPYHGKTIFNTLFKKNKVLNVLKFLDEKTSLVQDIRILSSLPFKPFLIALSKYSLARLPSYLPSLLLFFLAIGLWGVHSSSPDVFIWVESIILAFGLLSIGIPHGAVDHLLEGGNLKVKPNLNFILSYLGKAAAYLVFWLMFPNAALFFFLIYSVWHFGQSDITEWLPRNTWPLKNWIWGSFLMGIILLGHVEETNQIFEYMGVHLIPFSETEGKFASLSLVILAFSWGIWERHPAMLLSCAMLAVGIQLPLITSFGLYFIGQHSLNGWSHLKKGLKTDNTSLFLKALPFTAGAFLLFGFMLFCLENGILVAFNGQLIAAFFVFISCISFPHVLAMHRFYNKYF